MASVSVNLRIDRKLKEDSDRLFHDFGLNFTSAVTAFLRQSVREQRLPFASPWSKERSLTERALMDSRNDVDVHGPFNTFADMMQDIDADA